MEPLLHMKKVSTSFFTHEGEVKAVRSITLKVYPGEIVGIVGESGSGKSVSMMSVMRLIPSPPGRITGGEIWFDGRNLLSLSERDMEKVRGSQIAMIFQDPMTSLNPTLTVGYQIMEALKQHRRMAEGEARQTAITLLEKVKIPNAAERLKSYPHMFSGGMRQRVMIAMALTCKPKLLIADEPTTALDVTIQAQILKLVKDLQKEYGMSVVWITHDLGVVARLADRVVVNYSGKIVEKAPVEELFYNPRHPYTLGLLSSLPGSMEGRKSTLYAIPGQPPSLIDLPSGCAYSPRCLYASDICRTEEPELEGISKAHFAACWNMDKTEGVWKRSVQHG
jgi:oligopeptide transport system ATP-binding protein